ncbi:NAD(P)-dependent oxidoreductase [Mucilaginibacter sp. KACC 22773]|uniref:NAD-dependent epimerase/dehydratase family protein n=1 Tax=Mucilaginibacter sp. KACC 22773 TaxID=3025671 RepID=UPI002366A07A|nr:NAD(P)-dependent oxidoreductase [Mucilaginibacter sp. KACC 22773]WDF79146.1 NAD(P)-dependent oxidoreductase [Mucilaginibacter sp. KACC 22773]
MKIVVTGSTGFVGRHLIPELLNEGHQLLELTRNLTTSEKLYGSSTQKHHLNGDQEDLRIALNSFQPEVVIHLASFLTSADDYGSMMKLIDANIVFFCNLLDALKEAGLRLFINTGTFAEYFKGDGVLMPAYLYAATKTASRSLLDYYSNVYGFRKTTVIPYTIYGGKDSQRKIIDIIYDSIGGVAPVDLSPGEQVLDFIHIRDVVEFYKTLIQQEAAVPDNSVFHLGTGKGVTIKQLAAEIEASTGKKININWGGKSYRPSDVMYAVADTKTANDVLKWSSQVSMSQGVKFFLEDK